MVTLAEARAMEMEARKEPEFVTFQKEGDSVGGVVLTGIEKIHVKDKGTKIREACIRYTVEEIGTGLTLSFLGTYDLNTKLRRSDIGKVIAICMTGKRDTPNGAMNTFDVRVSKYKLADANAHGDMIPDVDSDSRLRPD